VDGHRRYADEPEKPSWYSGQSPYSSPYDSGVHERPSGAFRLPEQREETPSQARHTLDQPVDQVRVPVRGPEYPAVRPTSGTTPTETAVAAYNDPTSVVPPVSRYQPEPRQKDSVYRSGRPVAAILIGVATVALLVPAVLLLVDVSFTADPVPAGVVPAVLLTLGLPLTGTGLYALAANGPTGREAWLRTPYAFLPVGLVILLAAGLAVA
jgi:hypothetical protein